jgi:hypothetical protein
MPAPKTPQQEAEEQKLRAAEEQAKREERGGHKGEDGPSVSSKVGEHSAEIDSGEARKVDEAAERKADRETTKKP